MIFRFRFGDKKHSYQNTPPYYPICTVNFLSHMSYDIVAGQEKAGRN